MRSFLYFTQRMLLQIFLYSTITRAVTPTHELKEDIIKREYVADIRPTLKPDDVTTVTIVPNKFILLVMDQQQETIRFAQEFMMTWVDPHLTWNRSSYGYGRDWIKIPETFVWTPDVIFESAIDKTEMIPLVHRMIDLKYDGTLRQSNPSVMELPCNLRIQDFPFDVQICSVSVGSWNFDNTEIIMNTSSRHFLPEEDRFEGNSEWDLESIEAIDEKSVDPFTKKLYSSIKYKIKLKRKPVYYVLVIQAPTFIVSTLTIFGLFTPFSQGNLRREKVTLGLNMFVSISMMLNLVSSMMPKASRLPLLGNYILAEIFVCGSGVLVSILIITLHHRCHTRALNPPNWLLRIIFLRCFKQKKKCSNNTVHVVIQSTQFPQIGKIHDTLRKTTLAVAQEIKYIETTESLREQWVFIFDRVDLICLILFQTLNITASALFMR